MGVFSNAPDPETYYQVAQTRDIVKYNDVSEAQWFRDRLAYAYGGYAYVNVRMDADGTTILWFGGYRLPLGSWLYAGTTPMTDEQVYFSTLRPTDRMFPDVPPPDWLNDGITDTEGA